MLNGISPKAAIFGIPKKSTRLNTVRVSATITNKETAIVPAHPKGLYFHNKYPKKNIKHP